MRVFAGLGVKQRSVCLNDGDVRFIEVQLKHSYAPGDLTLEAVMQAQDQLQYDEEYDVLAFAHVQHSEASFNAQDVDDEKPSKPPSVSSHGGYLRLAVASKSSIDQVKTHKKSEVWYERSGQGYRFYPAWDVVQKQEQQLFWSVCLLCFSLPILLAMIWSQLESERLQSRRAVVLQFEKQQEQERVLLAQNQVQNLQIQKARNSWSALLENIQTLGQSMPKEASVQGLDWQKQRLQVKGIFPASQASNVSHAFAALLAKTSFTLQSESESGHGQNPIRFQLTRTW